MTQKGNKAHHPIDAANLLEAALAQILQPHAGQELVAPPFDAPVDADGNVALLADGGAEGSRLAPGGQVRERVGEIVQPAAAPVLRRKMPLEPQRLGHLHLDAHATADVAQQRVVRRVDGRRLGLRAVVEPEDHIAHHGRALLLLLLLFGFVLAGRH